MPFEPLPGVKYKHEYEIYYDRVKAKNPNYPELETWRTLIQDDLWFIVYFVLQVPIANHPFMIQACQAVEKFPKNFALHLWAREHGKTTIISVAETIQDIVNNPDERIALFSFSQRASLKIFNQVKFAFENSELLKFCFPDILYKDPQREAWKWSEDGGLWVRRKSMAKEATLEAWSLIEGMPIGSHFTKIKYDDVETLDVVNSPDMIQKAKDAFDLSLALGAEGGTHSVIGTTYHYDGLLEYLRGKTRQDGTKLYNELVFTATTDGTFNGPSRFLSDDRLDSLRSNRRIFAAQMLLNPSETGVEKLNYNHIKHVKHEDIPDNLIKFIIVDQAGENKRKDRQDNWAILCLGVQPHRDKLGNSNVYLLDAILKPMSPAEGHQAIVDMFLRNGRIRAIGIEKVGLSSTEIHVSNALRTKGRYLSVENGGIILLSPKGRKKEIRIEANLQWPLVNGKLHCSTRITEDCLSVIRNEMNKFPFAHDDALDALSYFYDVIKEYRFGAERVQDQTPQDKYAKKRNKQTINNGWMTV